ncbi:hypothetical protein SALBM135S_01171 [Streptomyces alboniger]
MSGRSTFSLGACSGAGPFVMVAKWTSIVSANALGEERKRFFRSVVTKSDAVLAALPSPASRRERAYAESFAYAARASSA